jgi:hypothetical protein
MIEFKRKILVKPKFALGLLLSAALSTIVFQNCSKGVLQDSASSSATGSNYVQNNSKAVGVVTTRQVFDSVLSVTKLNISQLDPAVVANDRFILANAISDTGTPESVNGPMWMAITNLTGLVCIDLVKDEANRGQKGLPANFVVEVNLWAPASSVTDASVKAVAHRMARSFWGRNETDDEMAQIIATMNSAFADVRAPAAMPAAVLDPTKDPVNADTSRMMYFLCSAMLASMETHKR